MNWIIELECLSLASLSSLVLCNTPAPDYGPRGHIHNSLYSL